MLSLVRGPKLDSLLNLLSGAPDGLGVEFGVYNGGTLLEMAMLQPYRRFVGFDTFAGLPAEAWRSGEPHGVGDFRDCSYEVVKASMPPNVDLVRGLFPDEAPVFTPQIGFAHVDFDYEVSTRDAIDWLKPRLAPGAVVVFDDYEWDHCPGVRRAIDAAGLSVQRSAEHQVYWVNA